MLNQLSKPIIYKEFVVNKNKLKGKEDKGKVNTHK